MMPPRPQFTMWFPHLVPSGATPGITPMRLSFTMFLVCGERNAWIVMCVHARNTSIGVSWRVAPNASTTCCGRNGSYTWMFIPIALATLPRPCPIRPKPMNPRFLPASSCPTSSFLSHFPSRMPRSARGICRACERRCASASSTTELVADRGEFTTITPAAEAALRSTLSTPTPARATRRSLLPGTAAVALSTAPVTLVALRMMMASHSARAPAASSSLLSFFLTTSWPAALRTFIAPSASPSVTMIFIFLMLPDFTLSCA
mmetsp:Transcript_23030/g.46566  ORF Transcript_23030/g.46566 Transcript_23030/m.46566 type:complete len:261 (+) Transcript_23030:405-1187(+)